MEIIPAILPRNFAEIEDKASLVKGLAPLVQVDICDGKFVPNTTWPYKMKDANFEEIIREERGMPMWEDIDYEFDLMIENPTEEDARNWLSAGAKRIVLHVESSADLTPVLSVLNGLVEIGIAFNIQTPLDALEKYKDKFSFVQLMGIRKVGFQGQAFDDRVLKKIKEVKDKYPELPVQIDGGVSIATAGELKEADRLVVGSTLFESDNIVDTYRELGGIMKG
jgi:ribulose-phosphate 3-epimerase